MKDIYVIYGARGSGKSTFARKIYNGETNLYKYGEPLTYADFFFH